MKRNRTFWFFYRSPQIAIFLHAGPHSLTYPAVTKEINIRCNPLAKSMYNKDSYSPELSIDNAETRATVTSIISSQPISPA